MKEISRRNFLKGLTAGAISISSLGALGKVALAEEETEGLIEASSEVVVGLNEALGSGSYTPGTYTASAQGMDGPVTVTATFSESSITKVEVDVSGETPGIGAEIGDTVVEQIMAAQNGEIEGVSGATVSSTAVKTALEDCIAQASGAASEGGEEAPAEEVTGKTITVEKTTDFSTIKVEATVDGGKIVACNITSEGANDLLNDDSRKAFAEQIVEKQDVDAVSGVTISSNAIKEAVQEILAQAGSAVEEEVPAEEEAPAEEVTGEVITVEKVTDFST
ncbi:MAG: FMN-binding protein, partial [Lachnospiraceae bacterium]|nr:FMN-binding protein [Lachnospiraceae bacterium]